MDSAGIFKLMEVQEVKILGAVLAKNEKVAVDNMWEWIVGGMERRLIFLEEQVFKFEGENFYCKFVNVV